ncbi:alpha/beta fold hydrolase [Novosphingobium aquiterrae]|uniref:Alpha/beta fold hydrolase n=1 Tax=Novosphingobium aquiterrae TaxID=624388 RepID=A0ABV6PK72_9SPHN
MTGRIAYFHGMPGGPGEWSQFAPPALREGAVVPDRNEGQTVEQLAGLLHGDGWTLIGFSLGAPIALQVAARLGDRAAHIHLVSPAGPLQLGDFLPHMAGGALFRLAAQRPALFRALVHAESLVARIAPAWLMRRLMAGAAGADAALVRDKAFIVAMAGVLRNGLGRNAHGFIAEVLRYVSDWRESLAAIGSPTTIWQGDADTWTPPAMATALKASLPGESRLVTVPGASHYSALAHALKAIAGP